MSRSQLGLLLASVLITLSSSARQSLAQQGYVLTPASSPVVEGLSLIYNPDSGRVSVYAPSDAPLTGLSLRSASGQFTGTCENVNEAFFEVCATGLVFKMNPTGFGAVDLGAILPHAKSGRELLGDLRLEGASLPIPGSTGPEKGALRVGAGIFLVHPDFAVPEPSVAVLAGIAIGLLPVMMRRRISS